MIGEPGSHGGAHHPRGIGSVQATITALLVAVLLVIVITTVAGGPHRSASAKPTPARSTPVKLTPVLPTPEEPTPGQPAPTRSLHAGPAAARGPGPASVAAVYGDPLGCIRVTIEPADPSYARVVYNRVGRCGRNNGTITATYHYADGEWMPVLDAKGYACPVACGRVRSRASSTSVSSALLPRHSAGSSRG